MRGCPWIRAWQGRRSSDELSMHMMQMTLQDFCSSFHIFTEDITAIERFVDLQSSHASHISSGIATVIVNFT